jgi:hypothetical protein
MTIETTSETSVGTFVGPAKPVYVKKTYSPEYLAERERLLAEVMAEGEKRIHRAFAKAIALGIIDETGKRIKTELPNDMLPGSDRDFGG